MFDENSIDVKPVLSYKNKGSYEICRIFIGDLVEIKYIERKHEIRDGSERYYLGMMKSKEIVVLGMVKDITDKKILIDESKEYFSKITEIPFWSINEVQIKL